MAEDAPAAAQSMTREELQAEAELRVRDIGQRFGTLPQDKDELLRLLEYAETWLIRLDQDKTRRSRSMLDTLSPTKAVLISRGLLDHHDPDVKLAVTSCITEVTRITAPDSPYGDDVMEEVFQRIVGTFADLGDISSPSYERRISILDSFATVRCCILMLDLGLDGLILDMFHHLFKVASLNHSEKVIQDMETILGVVIEESDDIHAELATCLLENLTKEAQVNLPASFGLAARLVGLCKDRLKPVFAQLLRGKPLDNYSNVVTFLCQDASNAVADNNLDASRTSMTGEGKFFERSVSQESPQETSKLKQDVNCPGQDGTRLGITPTTAISNGGALRDNNKSPDGSASSEQKPELSGDDQAKIEQLISDDKEVSEPVTTEKPSNVNSKKSQKLDSSTGSEATEQSKVVKDNESLVASEELPSETDRGDNKQLTKIGKKAANTTPAVTKKRGRPPATKSQGKKPVRTKQGADLKPGKDDPVSDSGGRFTRKLTKEDTRFSSMKAAEGESVKKQRKSNSKLQKEDAVSNKGTDEDTSLKEMVSAAKTATTMGQQKDNGVSKRKCLPEAEEAPPSKKNKVLDENLVGSRIRVWWPDDKMFYNGVVESFIASSKKHKVVYDDGDVEILLLGKERWEFIDEEQDGDPDVLSAMPHGRRGKGSLGQEMKEGKTGTPESGSRDPPKKRGRPKGVRSSNNMSTANSHASSTKIKGKGAEKDTWETPGGWITRSAAKAKDDIVKGSNKDEVGSTKSAVESNDKAGNEENNSNDEVKSSETVDGSKTYGLSTKRKLKEKESESSAEEKAPSKVSTGKKRGRKSRN